MRNFIDEQTGQAFTMDLLLALVIITMILGISADAIDIASHKVSSYSERFSLERVTNDAADMLIKTPGSPDDWEFKIDNLTTPGLAENDSNGKIIPNTLSMEKIIALKNNYNSLIYGKVLPTGVNSSLMIYPSNPSLSPIEIMKNDPKNAAEIAVANRTVTFDPLDIKAVIYNDNHEKSHTEPVCPNSDHLDNLDHKEPHWACQYFNISLSEVNYADFYIITDPENIGDNSPSWTLDRPEKGADSGNGEHFSANAININEKILNLLGNDTKGVLWFHVRTPGNKDRNFNTYIISIPKGTNSTQVNVDNLNPEPWFLVLQVWY